MFRAAEPARRSPLSLFLSLALHAGMLAGAVLLAAMAANSPAVGRPASLTFVAALAPPRVLADLTQPDLAPESLPEPEPLPMPELPEPELEFVRPEPVAPEPEPEPVAEPEPEPEEPPAPAPPPAIELGLFGGGQQVADEVRLGEVVDTGFDQEVAEAPELLARAATVGVLDAGSETPRPGRERPAATVTSAGFGGPTRESTAARPRQGVVTGLGGFGATAEETGDAVASAVVTDVSGFASAEPEPMEPLPPAEAAVSGFEVKAPEPAPAPVAGPVAIPDSPVEVEFKPTPQYSDEAREAGIEGDVALEVEFTAAGAVRVLRVIEGLGYGLDERAMRAAEQMQFAPAVRGGRKVDTRAVVYIVFRLT